MRTQAEVERMMHEQEAARDTAKNKTAIVVRQSRVDALRWVLALSNPLDGSDQ